MDSAHTKSPIVELTMGTNLVGNYCGQFYGRYVYT